MADSRKPAKLAPRRAKLYAIMGTQNLPPACRRKLRNALFFSLTKPLVWSAVCRHNGHRHRRNPTTHIVRSLPKALSHTEHAQHHLLPAKHHRLRRYPRHLDSQIHLVSGNVDADAATPDAIALRRHTAHGFRHADQHVRCHLRARVAWLDCICGVGDVVG